MFVGYVFFAPNGRQLVATTGRDRDEIHVLDLVTGATLKQIRQPGGMLSLALHPDGRHLATSGISSGLITIWDMETGGMVRQLSGHVGGGIHVDFSHDGT